MQLTVVGCGDAFGSGGRLQTSFHVSSLSGEFLIDCGATTLLGLQRLKINPDNITKIFITHLHGDHFSGLAWLLIYFVFSSKRKKQLLITGPSGLEERFFTVAESLFPGSLKSPRDFELKFVPYINKNPLFIEDITIHPFEVSHPSGAPSYGLRISCDGRIISFSGDTEWVDVLRDIAEGADIFITECFTYRSPIRYHLNWTILEKMLPSLNAQKVLISHMGSEMLAHKEKISFPNVILGEDGQIFDI